MDIEEQMTWEDSERFEEDSLCSFASEIGSSSPNSFRGWEEPGGSAYNVETSASSKGVMSLTDISAKAVAKSIPFEMVERFKPPVPEVLQQRIAFFSFPEKVADIRLYCCLGNGAPEEFVRGKALYLAKGVREIIQIGFHLSAVVQSVPEVFHTRAPMNSVVTVSFNKNRYHVAITLDRQKIISCVCTCEVNWCQHSVAACLYRIKEADRVPMRAPVSESLSQLDRSQLQKFAQNLVAQLPRNVIPIAQKLLDELLNQKTKINTECGAPDPTAGAAIGDLHAWSLPDETLREIVQKLLDKYCAPSPLVYSDVNFLSNSSPAAASEFQVLLRPFRGREPEGLWNLLAIVREMMRRRDNNAIRLLNILTTVCLINPQMVLWWYSSKETLVQSRSSIPLQREKAEDDRDLIDFGTRPAKQKPNSGGHLMATKYSCALLMDEIVHLWRLAALNPVLSLQERRALAYKLSQFQASAENTLLRPVLEGLKAQRNAQLPSTSAARAANDAPSVHPPNFHGFKEAYEACLLDWKSADAEGAWFPRTKLTSILPKQYYYGTLSGDVGNSQTRAEHPKEFNLACSVSRSTDIRQPASWNESLDNHEPLYPTSASKRTQRLACPRTFESDEESLSTNLSRSTSNPEVTEGDLTEEEIKSPPYDGSGSRGEREKTSLAKELCAVDEPSLERRDWTVAGSSFAKLPVPNDPTKIRFALCEGLHAHGYLDLARKLAAEIARDMVNNQEGWRFDVPPTIHGRKEQLPQGRVSGGRKKKRTFDPHQATDAQELELTESVCETLSSACFLLSVLVEKNSHENVAFQLGLFMLSLRRNAAASKFLETKIFYLENEILNQMKTMTQTLTDGEMDAICECAELITANKHQRWSGAIPISLTVYLARVLLFNKSGYVGRASLEEQLGFEVALAGLAMKTDVDEEEHPMLYECMRRLRGELTVELFLHFKFDSEKLAKILDTLLDIELHQMHHTYRRTNVSLLGRAGDCNVARSHAYRGNEPSPPSSSEGNSEALTECRFPNCAPSSIRGPLRRKSADGESDAARCGRERCESVSEALDVLVRRQFPGMKDCSGGSEYSTDPSLSEPCPVLTSSSATWPNLACSLRNRKTGCFGASETPREPSCTPMSRSVADQSEENACGVPSLVVSKYGYQKREDGEVRLPSESHVHFMMELAKRLSTEAGGNRASAVFTAPDGMGSHVHAALRPLHLCSFHVGLYALGLNNKLSTNWQSRTYSSFVSWISSQAMDIGSTAINILMDTWEKHLTPSEVATLADKASQSRDPSMVEAAARLALSVLPHAQFLNSSEIQRAVSQCKEQSNSMLENACFAVERAGKTFGVCPEVLFQISLQWYEVYKEAVSAGSNAQQASSSNFGAMSADAHSRSTWLDNNCIRQLLSYRRMVQLPLMMEPTGHEPTRWNAMQPVPYRDAMQQYYASQRMNLIGQPMFAISGPMSMSIGFNGFNGQGQPQPAPVAPTNPVAPTGFCGYGGQAAAPQAPSFWRPPESMYGSEVPFGAALAACLPPFFGSGDYAYRRQYDRVEIGPPAFPHGTVSPQTNEVNANLENVSSEEHAKAACYLHNAYRVGMLAMKTMGRRISDERSYTKFCENPPYGDDVKLLLVFAKKLGLDWVLSFAAVAAESVLSPFVLWELFIDVVDYVGRTMGSTPNGAASNLQMNLATLISKAMSHAGVHALLEKCHEMFHKAALQKLSHPRFAQSDADELITLVRAAQVAFSIGNNSQTRFNDFMQSLKRQKACKKELWVQLVNAVNFK